MLKTRALLHGALLLGLGLGGVTALGGCGDSSDAPLAPMTDAQKAEKAAREKETEDAFKESQKNKKKGAPARKPSQTVNGVPTS